MWLKPPMVVICAAALACVALTQAPPLFGVAAFFVYAVILRFLPSDTLPKDWLVYGSLGGICLFAAATLFIAYLKGEMRYGFCGEPPNTWIRIGAYGSFPIGGLAGALAGFVTALLIRDAERRTVVLGTKIGLAIAALTSAAYITWLLLALAGRPVKYPFVVVVFCIVVTLLFLTVGGFLGTLLGALISRVCRQRSEERQAS